MAPYILKGSFRIIVVDDNDIIPWEKKCGYVVVVNQEQ